MSVISKYSKSVQQQIKSVLGAYDTCTVTTESDGSVKVSTGVMVLDNDTRSQVEFYTASQVLTPAEKMLAYAQSFYAYPVNYTGRRDYREMAQAKSDRAMLVLDNNCNIIVASH